MIANFIIIDTKKEGLPKTFENFEHQFALQEQFIMGTNSPHTLYEDTTGKKIIIIGDYIGTSQELLNAEVNEIPKLKGNFYAIVTTPETVAIYSSFFSILPLYHTIDHGIIASAIDPILQHTTKEYTTDKTYILENLLFNYGFFNRTLYQEIKLIPCHHYLHYSNNQTTLQHHFDITEWYTQTPKGGAKTASVLSDLFIETTKHYFPDAYFDIAFTSGFDGRTLVSCALHHQKTFGTFSFGRPEIADVRIPSENAKALHIPYRSFDIGHEAYLDQNYLENANEYTTKGYKGNGYLQSHYVSSTKKIAKDSNYMLSGYVGSELFRALHATGTVTAAALRDVFMIADEDTLREKLKTSSTLNVLQKETYTPELNALIEEVLLYKRKLPKNISLNQQFYTFIFEETIRKFFGQKITLQQQYINVRTPFLDAQFVYALLQTKYAGANNDFFTQNPLKRTKGQYIYTDIIKKTNPIIYRQMTGKGYRPIDVRNPLYMVNIIYPFFKKRFLKKVTKTYMDNFGIVTGVLRNIQYLYPLLENSSIFDTKKLSKRLAKLDAYSPEKERDTLLLSLALLQNIANTKALNLSPLPTEPLVKSTLN